VTKPCFETRVAILKAKSQIRGLELPDDVMSYIATKIDSNARELEGAINALQSRAAFENRAITLELAEEAMGEPKLETARAQITLQNVIDSVTSFYNVRLSDLQSKRRHKSITLPRQVCMWLARRRTRFSLQEIGGYFGGRDHTTVMHSIAMVEERMAADSTFAQEIQAIEASLEEGRQ
jgi:chromosomal replication initiator protein